ncbi:MAG: hypothetical protein LQ338_005392 [Usnochroma carphineum]|nr:MAG: hypothetical protein LQ338_005392 [Usnochroma carphineum]
MRPSWTPLRSAVRPTTNHHPARSSLLPVRDASSNVTGGDLGNPQSTSRDESEIKSSRATDSDASPDTASLQQPVSDRSSIPGDQDEGTPSHDKVKQDPNKPAGEKRKNVESQGEKPLGPEDHQ